MWGPAIHVILLAAGLNPEKYETLLVSGVEAPQEGNMLKLAEEKGVQPCIIPDLGRELHPLRDLKTIWQLYRLFRKEQPDIVHTHTAKAGGVGRWAAALAGVPVIVHTFHGHVLHGYFNPFKTAFFRIMERLSSHLSSKIIAVSDCCRRDLIRYQVCRAEKVQTTYLGLELERFRHPDSQARGQLRDEWNIPQEAFLVGIIARLVPIKRHEDLFQAIPAVLEQYPDTWFAVIGDGERRQELENLARELKISHRCVFTGFREDQARVCRTGSGCIDLSQRRLAGRHHRGTCFRKASRRNRCRRRFRTDTGRGKRFSRRSGKSSQHCPGITKGNCSTGQHQSNGSSCSGSDY